MKTPIRAEKDRQRDNIEINRHIYGGAEKEGQGEEREGDRDRKKRRERESF